MKIVIFAVGKEVNKKDIAVWLDFYKKSNSNLEPILIYDKNTPHDILEYWPYEKRINSLVFDILQITNMQYISQFLNFTYVDVLKVSAHSQVGECLVTDTDTCILKSLNEKNIPECNYGLVNHHSASPFFTKNKKYIYSVDFKEFDFLQWANTGVQIQRENILPVYLKLFQKNFQNIANNLDFICYAQAVAGLTLRYINGIYLQPEWNWYYDMPYNNNSVIIKHYYGQAAKEIFRNLI